MSIDPALKMWSGVRGEKGLLRAAFADLLPKQILRRRKLEFSAGSGVEPGLLALAARRISDRDILLAQSRFPVDTPKTKEELLYREIFEDHFPGEAFRAGVSRWVMPSQQHAERGTS